MERKWSSVISSGFFLCFVDVNNHMNINIKGEWMHFYDVEVTRVIDGDTFIGDVHTHIMDSELILRNIYFRMLDINAPEMRGASKPEGQRAKEFLEGIILGKIVQVDAHEHDSFGRKLAKVFYYDVDINQLMITRGYAVPYED